MTVFEPSDLVFQDELPKRVAPRSKYSAVREAVRQNPGKWARVAEDVTWEAAHALRRRNPGFEVTIRGSSRNLRRGELWMRYTGVDDNPAAFTSE